MAPVKIVQFCKGDIWSYTRIFLWYTYSVGSEGGPAYNYSLAVWIFVALPILHLNIFEYDYRWKVVSSVDLWRVQAATNLSMNQCWWSGSGFAWIHTILTIKIRVSLSQTLTKLLFSGTEYASTTLLFNVPMPSSGFTSATFVKCFNPFDFINALSKLNSQKY